MLTSRIDSVGAFLITVVYLVGCSFATSWYFSDGFNGGLFTSTSIIASLLAFAVEGHNYMQQRRTKIAFRAWQRANDEERDDKFKAFILNLGIVVLLVSVLSFYSLMYNAETFHPTGSLLPLVVQQVAKGLMLPFLYLLTVFMVHVDLDASEISQRSTFRLFLRATKTAHTQFDKRFKAIERGNKNAAPLAIALATHVGDDESSKGIAAIDSALSFVETGHTTIDNRHMSTSSPDEDDESDEESDVVSMNGHRGVPVVYFELTDLQRSILALYQQGKTQTQMSDILHVAQSTISLNLQTVKRWLQARQIAASTV